MTAEERQKNIDLANTALGILLKSEATDFVMWLHSNEKYKHVTKAKFVRKSDDEMFNAEQMYDEFRPPDPMHGHAAGFLAEHMSREYAIKFCKWLFTQDDYIAYVPYTTWIDKDGERKYPLSKLSYMWMYMNRVQATPE